MTLEEFNQYVERKRPETLDAAFIAKVKPNPWVLRAGHGQEARIRIIAAGKYCYERQPGDAVWRRVQSPATEFDLLDETAAA